MSPPRPGRPTRASGAVIAPEAVARYRAETPGTSERNHLNNAGAALQPRPVLEAVRDHLDLEARMGGYEAADARLDAVGDAYAAVAALLGCDPSSVAFTENATASFAGALSAVPFERGDTLVTTRHDYVSNQIQYLSLAERFGVEVVRAPDAPEGGVDPSALEELVHRRRPRLVAVTHVPTNSGLVQPVEAVGEICRRRDVLYLVDACQSVGQMPVDAEALGCDFLSGTARKYLRGPRGAGFLYVSDRALELGLEPLFPDLRGADWIADDLYQPSPDARRFESWEFAWALVLGMGAAARYCAGVGPAAIRERIGVLAGRLRAGLAEVAGATLLDRGPELCGIVTVAMDGWDHRALVERLRERRINASELSRGAAVLDFDAKGVESALRLSPHYYNTEGEIDEAVDALREAAAAGP